jgi:hypothetical protein
MSSTENKLIHGWVSSPDQRGTLDILWSCTVTVFLCSWSVLFLNVSAKPGNRPSLLTKFSWLIFTIFFPEILATFAQNQWLSARHSVCEFKKLGFLDWSLTHAFFADMGGFMLVAPDYKQFPVSAYHIHYLVHNGLMDYPVIDRQTLWDKNKADTFVRILTCVQVLRFALQCIGRAVQFSSLTTLELDLAAIILCTFPTFYFWFHKPLDVSTTIPLHLKEGILLKDVLIWAGDSAGQPFKRTPLDFVGPAPDPFEILDPIMWALEFLFGLGADPDYGPITTFKNTSRMNPGRVRVIDVGISAAITLSFIGIHFTAWNFTYPTEIERDISRGACVALLVCALSFSNLWLLMHWQLPTLCRLAGIPQVHTTTELCRRMHWSFQYALTLSHVGLYGIARLYIIGEAFAGLRALPVYSYHNVEYSNFLPHI